MATPVFGFKAAKAAFFDTKAVLDATNKAERQVLSQFGAFVRETAKRSIRKAGKRAKHSRPGQPPKSQTGTLKRLIAFAYDFHNASVVIGPAISSSKSRAVAPRILEEGGPEIISVGRRGKRKQKRVVYKARPYMGPAFAKERAKMPAMWKDTIK